MTISQLELYIEKLVVDKQNTIFHPKGNTGLSHKIGKDS